ncbi:MAG: hypothetical protein Kow0069_31950 [Promethearchaeota archaeon]
MTFEVTARDAGGRLGRLRVGEKTMVTPNIFVVVSAENNVVPPAELRETFGAQAVFTNAYLAYKDDRLRRGFEEAGVHSYLGFPGVVATDSGAFQYYMYRRDVEVTPEEIEAFQERIGADCPVILDQPVQLDDPWDVAKDKVELTLARARDNVGRRTRDDACWFGPVHGTQHLDLVRHSAREMSKLDFGIYAIGGVVKTFLNYDFALDVDVILAAKQCLTEGRPLHMFGLGLPQFFALAVACGCDTFDSAAYVLYARDGRYFTLEGTRKLEQLEEFPCSCPQCSSSNPREVKALPAKERREFLARHNLHVTFTELRAVRQAIREGTLWDLVAQRVRSHPRLLEAFERLRRYQGYFESKESSAKRRGIMWSGVETAHHPALVAAHRRLLARYSPPERKRVALLVPEVDSPSVGSPAIAGWLKLLAALSPPSRGAVHVIYVNPLLGPVPHELRYTYPFSHVVFSHGYHAEVAEVSTERCVAYFEKNGCYTSVVAFRPSTYNSEVGRVLPLERHVVDDLVGRLSSSPGLVPRLRVVREPGELAGVLSEELERCSTQSNGGGERAGS